MSKKRDQLIKSIVSGKINDPVTIAISAGIAIGGQFLSKLLAPKQPKQQVGLMSGTVQIQTSEQGTFIPEIYGAAPSVALVTPTAITWSSVVNATTGANGAIHKNGSPTTYGAGTPADQFWNAGAVFAVPLAAGQDAFIQFQLDDSSTNFSGSAVGFCLNTTPQSGLGGPPGFPNLEFGIIGGTNITGQNNVSANIISHTYSTISQNVGGPSLGNWYPGDVFRIERRNNIYHLYRGFAEVGNFTPPTPTAVVYLAWAGWRNSFGLINAYYAVGNIGPPPSAGSGGCKVPGQVIWAKPPEKHQYTSQQTTGSGKHASTTTVEQIYYTIDIRYLYARGGPGTGLQLLREYGNTDIIVHQDPNLNTQSNVYNPSLGDIGVYDPKTPPDPTQWEKSTVQKNDGDLTLLDGGIGAGGGYGGSIQGGASTVEVYPGTLVQDISPTEEADIDGKYGAGSTPAHRGTAGTLKPAFNLQRWDNLVPNHTAVWQHSSLKMLSDIYSYLCTNRIVDQYGNPLLGAGVSNIEFLTSVVHGSVRSNFTGQVGIRFTTPNSSPPTISALGRMRRSTNTQTHAVTLYKDDGTVIATVNVDCSSGTPDAFKYVSITPVTLLTNTIYHLLSAETNGGDEWYDDVGSSFIADPAVGGTVFSNFTTSVPTWSDHTSNLAYVPVNLQYQIGAGNQDLDFSDASAVVCRGLLIDGRRYSPAEIIDNEDLQDCYNYFSTEGDGKLLLFQNGNEPAITIPWQDINWVEAGSQQEASEGSIISATKLDETKFDYEVDLKYVNPGNDWEPDQQSYIRKVTLGTNRSQLQVQATMNPDEAKQAVTRRSFRKYVGEPVKFKLTWKYMYIWPGYRITTTDPDGETYVMRLTGVSGGIGIRDCEAVLLEPAMYTQSLSGGIAPFHIPPIPIPATTILAAMDVPAFRPGEENQFGMYFAGCPRQTDTQQWFGFGLYIKRPSQVEYSKLDDFSGTPATLGKIASATDLLTDPTVCGVTITANSSTDYITTANGVTLNNGAAFTLLNSGGALPAPLVAGTTYFVVNADLVNSRFQVSATSGGSVINLTTNGTGTNLLYVGKITVDLYGSLATLPSATSETDMRSGTNRVVMGDTICGYIWATQVAGYPNRWELTGLLNGLYGTVDHITDTQVGRNFCFMDANVHFVSLNANTDLNVTLPIKAVSIFQDLADAADLSVVCTGNSARVVPVSLGSMAAWFDATNGNALLEWVGTSTLTPGLVESYDLEMRDGPGSGATTKLALVVTPELNLLAGNTPPLKTAAGNTLPGGQIAYSDPGGVAFTYFLHDFDINNYTGSVQSKTTANPIGTFVEFQVQAGVTSQPSNNVAPRFLQLNTDDNLSIYGWVRLGQINVTTTVYCPYENAGTTGTPFYQLTPGDRMGIMFQPDGTVLYFINYQGPSSQPFFTSPNKFDKTKVYRINIIEGDPSQSPGTTVLSSVKSVRWSRPNPEFMLTGDMQKGYNSGSLPGTIYGRIRQHSFNAAGNVSAWTYFQFLRV